jgi:hypothetical protein
MKLERAHYLNLTKAGLIVIVAMLVVLLVALRLPCISQTVRAGIGVLLLFPSVLVFLPIILHNGHNIGYGYFYVSAVLNWFFTHLGYGGSLKVDAASESCAAPRLVPAPFHPDSIEGGDLR